MKLIPAQVQLRHLLVRDFEQQQSKQQQGKFQQAASKKQTKHLTQPTASQKQKATDKPQQAFAQQSETDRQRMQENDEIAGVARVDIGDKRSYVRLVGFDGKLLEEAKVPTRPGALEKYFRCWPRLRVVLETGG